MKTQSRKSSDTAEEEPIYIYAYRKRKLSSSGKKVMPSSKAERNKNLISQKEERGNEQILVWV